MCFFFQAEDGIRDLVRSRGLGDVYKRQDMSLVHAVMEARTDWCIEIYKRAAELGAELIVMGLSLIHI